MAQFVASLDDGAPLPEWYTIGYRPPRGQMTYPQLIVTFARDVLELALSSNAVQERIVPLQRRLSAFERRQVSFSADISGSWGFNRALKPQPLPGGFGSHMVSYAADIPLVQFAWGKCSTCSGRGTDVLSFGSPCQACEGTGKGIRTQGMQINCIVETLALVLRPLYRPPMEWIELLPDGPTQTMLVSLATSEDRYLNAVLAAETMRRYMEVHQGQNLPRMTAGLTGCYCRMFPLYRSQGGASFLARFNDSGQLDVAIPDGCTMVVRGLGRSERQTCSTVCHRLGGVHHQLTLACGLAALADQLRELVYAPQVQLAVAA